PEYQDGAAHPMDRWSTRVITGLATALGGMQHYPIGGPPYTPFIAWAMRSGRAWQSPAGPLVHDRAGMMVSYRGAIALPDHVVLPSLPQPPCATCAERPCLSACPVGALSETSGYDVGTCHSYLDTGPACMTEGCAARLACPVSKSFPRQLAQSAFHMKAFHP
ncbi:MAG: ferredoxin, partial [Pseudomonadota bacterium]